MGCHDASGVGDAFQLRGPRGPQAERPVPARRPDQAAKVGVPGLASRSAEPGHALAGDGQHARLHGVMASTSSPAPSLGGTPADPSTEPGPSTTGLGATSWRLDRLGLQRRIMAYVTIGLTAMFGVVAILGFQAIDQATQLVFAERLATAHTTASIIERDFERLAVRAREEALEASQAVGSTGNPAPVMAAEVLEALGASDVSPFFRVRAVWLVDGSGSIMASAGSSGSGIPDRIDPARWPSSLASDGWAITRSESAPEGDQPFASVLVRFGPVSGDDPSLLMVDTVSINSTISYVPAAHGRRVGGASTTGQFSESEAYHLEVVDVDGTTLLGVGPDEQPGAMSPHAHALAKLVGAREAAALLHEPGPGDVFEAHVMAAVPLAATPFYVVLEQPVDVALALPQQLRQRLLLWIAVGLVATLIVAWVTTRHVVKPSEELTAAAVRMAGGDLSSPIMVTAQDEIGQLARALEVMRERLSAAHESIERTNVELEARVAERTARLGQLLQRTISAQEEERQRLARELHDETAQTLTALSIAVDRVRDSLPNASPHTREQVQLAKALAERLLAETRRLMLGLRPMLLDDLGLLPAIRWLCETAFSELDVVATVEGDPAAERLAGHIEVALFRIAQEAINNVAHHAGAHNVRVKVVRDVERVTVEIVDDGGGFDPDQVDRGPGSAEHMGLIGMRERVGLLGGRLEVDSGPGRGTRLLVEVPLAGVQPTPPVEGSAP